MHIALHAVRDPIAGPSLDAAAAVITGARGAPFRGATSLPGDSAWLTGDAAVAVAASFAAPDAAARLAAVDACATRDLLAIATAGAPALPTLRLQQGGDAGVWVRIGVGGGDEPEVDVHVREPLAAGANAVLFVPTLAPGLAALHQINSPPTGLPSSQSRSSCVISAPPSHWASSSSSV